MYTWTGAPCCRRYTGLHSCTAAAQGLLRRAEYTCWHRRGPHASTNSPIQHVRNHPRPLLCLPCLPGLPGEMETSTLFLTRLDDDRGLERSLEPTHLGTRGTHLHSRSVTRLSCADRVPSSNHQHRQSNLSPIAVRGHAIVPLDVYLLLVGLVCAGTRPAAYACACTNNL